MSKTKQKCPNDKFYTSPDVVDLCLSLINVNAFETIIEPSAGNGSFSNRLPEDKTIALDISPEHSSIIEADYLSYQQEHNEDTLVIGNPPFGVRGSLIKSFIKHSIKIDADVIAFVLPLTYRKYTNQKVFPKNWKLKRDINLPEDSFLLNGESYHVPCCFQVWVKDGVGIDLRNRGRIRDIHLFDYVDKKEVLGTDLFIMGASPATIKKPEEVSKNNRGYWIRLKKGVDVESFVGIMKSINWKQHALSSVSGNVAWFTKQEINEVLYDCK